jgi:rhodanese-related sulfurtransferase
MKVLQSHLSIKRASAFKGLTGFLFLFLIAFFGMGCTQTGASDRVYSDEGFSVIAPVEFAKRLEDNSADYYLIDIRTPEEFEDMRLNGATLINYYASDFKANLGKLDKNKPVYLYCATGGRSSSATKMMHAQGFKSVTDLKGGIYAWRSNNLPLVGGRGN